MARPTRRPAPRKPSAAQPIGLEQAKAAATERPAGMSDEGFDRQAAIQQLMQEFDAVLRNEPGLDHETRELIQQHFDSALRDSALLSNASMVVPDRATFMETVQALKATGAVAKNEVDDLIRQIDQALQPLQRRESQLALEFSRRVQTDGQDEALAWFREASKALSGSDQDKDPHAHSPQLDASPLLRSEVINSRSRRVRGPPKSR